MENIKKIVMRHKDGRVFREYYVNTEGYYNGGESNAPKHGLYITYNSNGSVYNKCNYINNEIEGEDIFYYNNGNIDYKENYINGKKINKTKYNKDGTIERIEIYDENGNDKNNPRVYLEIKAKDYSATELLFLFKRNSKEKLLVALHYFLSNKLEGCHILYDYDNTCYTMHYDKKHFVRLKKELEKL